MMVTVGVGAMVTGVTVLVTVVVTGEGGGEGGRTIGGGEGGLLWSRGSEFL